MIANVKRPKEWNIADWGVVVGLFGIIGTGAWNAGNANMRLEAVQETLQEMKADNGSTRLQVNDHERRISILESKP